MWSDRSRFGRCWVKGDGMMVKILPTLLRVTPVNFLQLVGAEEFSVGIRDRFNLMEVRVGLFPIAGRDSRVSFYIKVKGSRGQMQPNRF
jgi:hypothetical protein